MATVVPLHQVFFGPDTTRAMGAAFDKAWRSFRDAGYPDVAREAIAERIIDLARQGDVDPDRLCDATLKTLGFHPCSDFPEAPHRPSGQFDAPPDRPLMAARYHGCGERPTNSSVTPIPFAHSMLRGHRHVCAFFNSPKQEYDTLLPFICDGLNRGERAFHVLPSRYREEHLEQLRMAGIDVEAARRSHQLEVALPEDTYLKSGRFNKDTMLALIQDALKAGTALGFPLTRMIAHAETAVDDRSSANEWVEYETRLNDVLTQYDDPMICTYDVNLLDANLALDILRAHPVAIIGGVLVENSLFSRPEDFLREVHERRPPTQPYRG